MATLEELRMQLDTIPSLGFSTILFWTFFHIDSH